MKTIIGLLLLLSVFVQDQAWAQFDEKFYLPSKVMEKYDWPAENLDFQTESELVTGIWLRPHNKPKASILYFHGAGGNVSLYFSLVRGLLEDGFQVVMIDFRGYGRSTGTPTHLNIAHDAEIVYQRLLNYPDIKDSQIIVMGASMGTQIAAHLARKHTNDIQVLVLDGTISSFTDIALHSSPKEMHSVIQTYVTSPYSAKEDVQHLGKMKLLMIHSKEDKGVPFEQAKQVFELANCEKTFWEFQGGHLEAPTLHKETWLAKINALLR